MSDKLITIGIGVYTRQKSYISKTLMSIVYNLQKNHYEDKVKILIVNDSDKWVQDYLIAQHARDRFTTISFEFKQNDKNMGIAYTYNRMIKQCGTPYFMAFDSDDIMTDFNIIQQVQFLQKNKKYAGSYGKRQLFDFERNIPYNCVCGCSYDLKQFIGFNCPVTHNALILRVKDALQTGNYIGKYLKQNGFKKGVDVTAVFSMFTAMLMYKDLYFVDHLRCVYNQHDKCYHKQKANLFISQFEAIAKSVIYYCQKRKFKYKNMNDLYQSANNFLKNEELYIQNSWLRDFR